MFQHDDASAHQSQLHGDMVGQSWSGSVELKWPAHSPDFNPLTEHLRDELESDCAPDLLTQRHRLSSVIFPQPLSKIQWQAFPRKPEVVITA